MSAKGWYKPAQISLILLSVALFTVGINFTESNATELDYGTMGGFSFDPAEHPDSSIIVIVEDTEGTCEDFEFNLMKQYEGSVPVEKTVCERWSNAEAYHYQLNLSYGYYTWDASDYVSVIAVEGALDAYMEDYALGNAIADLGACLCCLSILGYVVVGRGINKALNAEQHVNIIQTQPMIQQAIPPVEEPTLKVVESVVEPPSLPAEGEDEKEVSGSFWDSLIQE